MRRFRVSTLACPGLAMVFLAVRAIGQQPVPVENVSTFKHRTPEEERRALHVPPGFEVQLVAAEPDIQKPLNIAFDDKGRLWVTDTVEYPYPVEDGSKPRDTVKILSDFAPDGRARKIQTFADGLNIPIGVLPLSSGDEALVHSIPDIWRLKDSDGDGEADAREPAYQSIGHRDTHGMTNSFTWGFDGWIYACHGFSNTSELAGSDGKAVTMNSGNVYRMRPDGSHVEQVTHGQVNPFGLTFDAKGYLYSADCHSKPLYQLIRGGYYPSFGKPDDGLGFAPEMVAHDHGSTAISGIVVSPSEPFPAEYRNRAMVGNVVTNRINMDEIEWHGSTPKGIERPDFVWSEDNWFRPVCMRIGPDGAMYVADFYNRIIGHYEVPLTHPGRDRTSGRIWRIVYKGDGSKPIPSPEAVDRTESSVDDLIEDLKNPLLVVRTSATNQLAARGGAEAVAKLRERALPAKAGTTSRVHGLWALERLGALDDETLLKTARDEPSETIRVHALRVLVDRPALSPSVRGFALGSLDAPSPHVRRAAAEVLGAHPEPAFVRPLLDLRRSAADDDTHLIYVARKALRDQLTAPGVWPALAGMALDDRDRDDLADVAVAVPNESAAAFLTARLRSATKTPGNADRYLRHVARYGAEALFPALAEHARKLDGEARFGALRQIRQGLAARGAETPAELRAMALGLAADLLKSKDDKRVGRGIEAVDEFRLKEAIPDLEAVFARDDLEEKRRVSALSEVAALDMPRGLAKLGAALEDGGSPSSLREAAAVGLAAIDRPEARDAIVAALATIPEGIQYTTAAALARRKDGGEALLKAVAEGKASARLLQQRPIMIGLENAGIPDLAARVAKLLAGLPPADAAIKELIAERRDGFDEAAADADAGAKVFEVRCGVCHQMAGKGARVGPQLDGVGGRGLDRILEDVLDPNRNVDQMFRTTVLALEDGRVVSGLLLREEGEILVVADSQGHEIRVPKDEVEERETVQQSPMPADLARQIPEPEFRDLLGYLLGRREDKRAE